jgi:hypothetical protein
MHWSRRTGRVEAADLGFFAAPDLAALPRILRGLAGRDRSGRVVEG